MRSIGRRGDDVPVDHRLPRQHAGHDLSAPALRVGMRDELGLQLRLRRRAGDRPGPPRSPLGWLDAQLLGEALADPPRGRGRDHVMRRPALGDGAPEQPLGTGHGEQRADAHRAGRLAEDGDVAGIAAEGGDVVPHPLEGGDLVEQAEVGVSVAEIEEAVGADPVVDGHADDAVAGETTAVIDRTRTDLEHAARNPDHDRQPGRPRRRRPDVEVQAVLTGDGRLRTRARVCGSGLSWGGSGP